MAEIDNLEIVISAEAQSALTGLEKLKAALGGLKKELGSVDTKRFRAAMSDLDTFNKKLQNVGKNVKASDSYTELTKQIASAEKQLDSLLSREDKLKTVGGVDENSKTWRSLQYDISKTCNELDVYYAKMAEITASQSKFNITDYRDKETPKTGVNTDSMKNYSAAAQNVAASLERLTQSAKPAGAAVENLNSDTVTSASGFERFKGVLGNISDAFNRFKEKLSTKANNDSFNASMQETIDRIQELKHVMAGMDKGTINFDSTVYENAARTLAECTSRMNEYKQSVMGGTEETSRLRSVISGAGGAMSEFSSKASQAFGAVLLKAVNSARSALDRFKNSMPSIGKAFESFGKRFNSFFRLANLMLMRRALNALFTEMKNGFNALAVYSNSIGSAFNKNLSETRASLQQLGYQFVAAFQPIYNAVLPALSTLISYVNAAISALSQLFALLSGASVWTRAKKSTDNYAAGLSGAGGAAKKAKKEIDSLTTSIDELNILQTQSNDDGGGGGGGGGLDTQFEEVPIDPRIQNIADWLKSMWDAADFSELGALLAEKLGNALKNIPWTEIREACRKIGQSIGTFINGFIETEIDGKRIAWWIGNTVGNAINSAFEFIYGLVSSLHWDSLGRVFTDGLIGLYDALDWNLINATFEKIGNGLATMFNTIFSDQEAWTKTGLLLSNSINAVLGMGLNFTRSFNFEQYSKAMSTGFNTAIKGINWKGIGELLRRFVNGLFTTLKGFFDGVDWAGSVKAIVEGIGSFFSGLNWGSISGAISSAIQALHKCMIGFIQGTDWSGLPKYILDSLADYFKGFDYAGLAATFGELLGSALKGAVELMTGLWDMLQTAWGDLSSTFQEYIQAAGGNIIEGLYTGITDMLADAAKWILENIVNPFIDGVKKGFGIESPSKVMAEIGRFLIEGLWEGIRGAWGDFWAGITGNLGGLKDFFSNTFTTMKDGAKEKWEGIKNSISEKFNTAKEKVIETGGKLKEKVTTTWQNIKDKTATTWENIKSSATEKFNTARDKLASAANTVKDKVSTSWNTLKEKTSTTYQNIKSDTEQKFNSLRTSLETTSTNAKEFLSKKWEETKKNASDTWQNLKTDVEGKFQSLKTSIDTIGNLIKTFLQQTWDTIKSFTAAAWQALKLDVESKFTALKTSINNIGNLIKTFLQQTWDAIKSYAANAWSQLKMDVSAKFEALKSSLSQIADTIKAILSAAWESIKSTAVAAWETLKSTVAGLFQALHDSLLSVNFMDIGSHIVTGIWDGIQAGWDWLVNKVRDFAESLIDAAEDALDIGSPSKEFRDRVGKWIAPGIVEGMQATFPDAIRDIQKLSLDIVSSMQNILGDSVSVGRFVIDDSQLRNYSVNYGESFADATLTHRVQQELGLNSSIQAEIDGNHFIEQFRQIIKEEVGGYLGEMSIDVKRTAEKDPHTTVNIGGRVVAEEVQRQKSANGFNFSPSL